MFRQLPRYLVVSNAVPIVGTNPNYVKSLDPDSVLFTKTPREIATYLEAFWHKRFRIGNVIGHPDNVSSENNLPSNQNNEPYPLQDEDEELWGWDTRQNAIDPGGFLRWDHLIYAYMIENTRIYEIFRRVLYEYRHGEKLGTPQSTEMQNWLRITEELFYSDQIPLLITNVSSHIRLDLRANRRNAYQRMFGMDLNHGTDEGNPYSYIKAEAANSEFVSTFEEFLREVWVGITYVRATSSSDPTDDAKISVLARKMRDMLQSRRRNGNLSREEFAFVSMMSWLHLSLELDDSPVLSSLQANATGVDQRLFQIAQRVGLAAHGLSRNFFDIADPMSRILIQIEMGTYDDVDAVRALYDRNLGGPEPDMRTIITHWTAITGRDVKARKVATN